MTCQIDRSVATPSPPYPRVSEFRVPIPGPGRLCAYLLVSSVSKSEERSSILFLTAWMSCQVKALGEPEVFWGFLSK